MTVKELIERLTIEDPNKRVVVDGYESGYDEVDRILTVNVIPNKDKGDKEKDDRWWDGEFELTNDTKAEEVIVLPRKC